MGLDLWKPLGMGLDLWKFEEKKQQQQQQQSNQSFFEGEKSLDMGRGFTPPAANSYQKIIRVPPPGQ